MAAQFTPVFASPRPATSTSGTPCKYCGSTQSRKGVWTRSTIHGLETTVACENPAACRTRRIRRESY